jgi:uncharacterized protein
MTQISVKFMAMAEEKIRFANGRGDTLCGVLHYPATITPRGAVILCHGMDSDKNSEKLIYLARALAERGVLALRFDFTYVGESSGKFSDITHSGEVEDLRAAFNLVSSQQRGRTAILGSSMGGTIALLFAAQEPSVAGLVTIAAPVHPENFPKRILTARQIDEWRQRRFTFYHGRRINVLMLYDLEKLDVPAAARQIHCPVLILHGDKDEVVPVEEAYELDACLNTAKRLSILKGADHRLSNPQTMRQVINEALNWLTDSVA